MVTSSAPPLDLAIAARVSEYQDERPLPRDDTFRAGDELFAAFRSFASYAKGRDVLEEMNLSTFARLLLIACNKVVHGVK